MKIWQKNINVNQFVDNFTVGKDREMDLQLAKFDVLASLAHTKMLQSVNLLNQEDLQAIQKELKNIFAEIIAGKFKIEDNVEDVHSQVEWLLTQRIGSAGKKIHSGRSRNDQVLVDLKLYFRSCIEEIVKNTETLFYQLITLSNTHKDKLLPGYTHLQIAMPSSFGLWFGAYAESLADDMEILLAAWKITNKNPLGSAAGYGSSFPLNRTMTTELLGFEKMNHNVVYAQMGRGKTERILAQGMSAVAATLAKMAMDVCLYVNQNFGFISFPAELTTGSSIMPHKKNPDVFELVRSHCNHIQALPNQIAMMTTNLPSGYHRDLQLLKEIIFPAIVSLNECLKITVFMLQNIRIKEDILKDARYDYLFSVETVNDLTLKGLSFRDAYKEVSTQIETGTFKPLTNINHTHEGSMGNLMNDEIVAMMQNTLRRFGFNKVNQAIEALIK